MVKLIRGGAPYFHLLEQLINKAEGTIHLQFYIYDDDKTGTQVTRTLIAAVKRNVAVYLIADGYASQVMSKSFMHELKTAGIHFRWFAYQFIRVVFYLFTFYFKQRKQLLTLLR